MSDFEMQRKRLVEAMKLKDKGIARAFLEVKRELFFSERLRQFAYEDSAFPIGLGQTISQPSTIAIMLEMLAVKKGNKVLEIGAGSGYVAALLSKLAGKKGRVFGIELAHELHQKATRALLELGCKNVFLKCGDGTLGWKEKAPFDRIIVSAACVQVPKPLIEQLKEGGSAVAPIGSNFSQDLVLLQKEKSLVVEKESRCCFMFVPLKGKS